MSLLTPEELSERLKMPLGTIYSMERRDKSFPRAIRVTQRTLRWDEAEVTAWLQAKKEETNHEDQRSR